MSDSRSKSKSALILRHLKQIIRSSIAVALANRKTVLKVMGVIAILLLVINESRSERDKSREAPSDTELADRDVAQYVNPFIGTGGMGNTFPGAIVPWGMVAISPDTGSEPAGYKAGNSHIQGFSQTHLSGTGCADFGTILLQPTTGAIATTEQGYQSEYDSEAASPGYYRVNLSRYGIQAEMSATTRASISRYTFPARSEDSNIIVDVSHSLKPSADGSVRIVSDTEVEGWNRTGDFCGAGNKYTLHFVARFSKSARATGTWGRGSDTGAFFSFSTHEGEQILVRLGVSYVSIANARANLDSEIPQDKSFDQVRSEAYMAWNSELAKLRVSGGTLDQKRIFYTALYHNLIHPSVFSDVNGEYQGMNGTGVRTAADYTQYHVFSLWDTYRTTHSLLTLVYPERQLDMIKSMLAIYDQTGWLPQWQLAGAETRLMVGSSAAPVLAESFLKGIRSFDTNKAYEAIRKQATQAAGNLNRPGHSVYLQYGYVPRDDTGGDTVWGVASTSLEYYYSDWAAGQFAKALGHLEDYQTFNDRSFNWIKLYDSNSGFIRPKNKDSSWLTPFDPDAECCDKSWGYANGGPGYVEGNAWQYTWMIPHDLSGLKVAMGGDVSFTDRLQQAFDSGNYRLGNEPDMHYPYAFTYVPGQAWRTQRQVRKDMSRFSTERDGIPGNDDAGALSAAYLFNAIGFYPVNPASGLYNIGSPIFDQVTITLNPAFYPGRQFVIQTANNSPTNYYVQEANLNDLGYNGAFLSHSVVTEGGKLALTMGSSPTNWGSGSDVSQTGRLADTYMCGSSLAPNRSIAYAELHAGYNSWKAAYLTNLGAGGYLRVRRPANNNDTVSEGIGYGMLLSAYMSDRATFDALWGYAKLHLNSNGLMNWHIDASNRVIGYGSAADADEDMALALVVADRKWGAYGADARAIIGRIMTHNIEATTFVLKPGDGWGDSNATNPSYFAPAWYKVFHAYTGEAKWESVVNKSYEIIDKVNSKNGAAATGLQPDWSRSSGDAIPSLSYSYTYDAVRVSWRLATDAAWHCDARANSQIELINAFFRRIGASNIKDGYRLDGTLIGKLHNAAFVAPAAAAAITSKDSAYRLAIWNEAVWLRSGDYYGDHLRLLSLLLASGHMPNPISARVGEAR